MAVYLVAYEGVPDAGARYGEFCEALEKLGAERVLSSVYVIASSGDAQSLHQYLSDFLAANDRILVSRLTEDFSGYVLENGGAWLARHKPL